MGNRIAKHVYNNGTGLLEKSTYYILDAQGQQISMYEHNVGSETVSYYLAERNIYGSSRLGVTRDTINMYAPELLPSYGVLGNRNYELSNHLGNVLAVINDVKIPLDENADTYVDGYQTGIVNVSDYSPFGVELDGRTIKSDFYRYSFQNQEHDDEVKGEGNSLNFKYRMHDPRVGRFFATDPLEKKYSYYSPYVFSGNRVIDAIELEGLEPINVGKKNPIIQELVIRITHDKDLVKSISSLFYRQSTGSAHKATFDVSIKLHEVFAVASGKVFAVGTSNTYGNYLITEHTTDAGTFYVLYAHLSKTNVEVGQAIGENTALATSGNTGQGVTANKGQPLGYHLHVEVLYLPINQTKPKNYSELIQKRNAKIIQRFNAISKSEVENNPEGNKWLKEKGAGATDWNTGDIPIQKLLNIKSQPK